MKQINSTVIGTATDVPELTVDNGHSFLGVFESTSRVIFTLPDTEPPWGATIAFDHQTLRYVIPVDPGAYEGPVLDYGPSSLESPQIVGDHFELHGQRWAWAMTTGFCDYKLFLDGGDLVSLLKQNQDLGAHGRRVFMMMKNIVDFNPDNYGQAYFDRIPEYCSINAEYGQYVNPNAFPDSQLLGWSLSKCQDFWGKFTNACRPCPNAIVSLTNEFDHGGNLVGVPNDYPMPPGMLSSQGSAVQDATPPCPKLGTGSAYQIFEWHAADDPTHFSHEYYIWQGLSTGRILPTIITEMRRLDPGTVDLNYVRTITYASLANGCGLTVHTGHGKYSQLLAADEAAGVSTAMEILRDSH